MRPPRVAIRCGLVVIAILLMVWWYRSQSRADVVVLFLQHGTPQAIVSVNGRLMLAVCNVPMGDSKAFTVTCWTDTNDALDALMFRGCIQGNEPSMMGSIYDAFGLEGKSIGYIAVSHWALAGCAALPGVWSLRHLRRSNRRRARGLCPNCGYDLRASRDRCPECGDAVVGAGSSLGK
jgi:hypothetical protein